MILNKVPERIINERCGEIDSDTQLALSTWYSIKTGILVDMNMLPGWLVNAINTIEEMKNKYELEEIEKSKRRK